MTVYFLPGTINAKRKWHIFSQAERKQLSTQQFHIQWKYPSGMKRESRHYQFQKKKRLFIFRILNTKEWLQEKEKNYTVLKYRDIYYTMIKVSIHQERYKNPEHVFSRKQSCKIFKVKTDWTERKKNRQLHNQIPTYDKTSQEIVKNGLFPLDKKYLQKTYAYYDT